MSKLIQVSDKTYSKLDKITKSTALSMQEVMDKAVENLDREMILKQANETYAAIKKDQKLWQEEQEELAL